MPTIGNESIFLVWISVTISNASSSVPKPPGMTTNAHDELDEHDLADEEMLEVDEAVDVGIRLLLHRQV